MRISEINNAPTLSVHVGYDDAAVFGREMTAFIAECNATHVFLRKKIGAADYNTVNDILAFVQSGTFLLNANTLSPVLQKFFSRLSPTATEKLSQAIIAAFSAIGEKKPCNDSFKRNAFVRVIFGLQSVFSPVLENTGPFFYEGELNKYDFITINILALMGISGNIVCFKHDGADFVVNPLFNVNNGRIKSEIEFALPKKPALSNRNIGLNFIPGTDIEDAVSLLKSVIERDNGNFISVQINGAGAVEKFKLAANKFYLSAKTNGGAYVIDESFGNPTYDEMQNFDAGGFSDKTIDALINTFPALRNTDFPLRFKQAAEEVLAVYAQKANAEKVFKLWLCRLRSVFETRPSVIIIWRTLPNRVMDFLSCLESLPVNIIHFSPNAEPSFSESALKFSAGQVSDEKFGFPYKANKLAGYSTVALQAQQEIRQVLSGDATRSYQMRQFSAINPVVLKTTFEEIDIIWREPAKFRPTFTTAGGVVTIPSIFAKINGVDGDVNDYLFGIKSKITPETLLLQKFPFITSAIDGAAVNFFKQIYYNEAIDAEKLKKSSYYRYNLFSDETQNVILKGISDFIKNDWFIKERASHVYDILEVLFRMPPQVLQMIHNFSFTETVPKVVVFNSTDKPCEAADCILITFLKSLGFDVIMYIPTGYRVVEQHITSTLFQTIDIGACRFDLTQADVTRAVARKGNPLKNLFKRSNKS
ncbi:MAG: YceG family protein [Clostridiales bacterium]|jgi:hypothetical protein|nr:YceG family protein [Clostridiales bacterium]